MADEVVLVVDDDDAVRQFTCFLIKELGYRVEEAKTGEQALAAVDLRPPAAVMLDVVLPGIDGLGVLRRLREKGVDSPVVMLSAYDQTKLVVEAMRLGAQDFLTKPVGHDEVRGAITSLLARRKAGTEGSVWRQPERLLELRGRGEGAWGGEKMARVEALVDQVADTDATVLIRGESGVGKELVARALHQRSRRSGRPWVKVNCAALPTELLESELFGYERGAFTGAHRRKPGRFELAEGGAIFLDEIGEVPLSVQAKLLQVLQDGEFTRLGGERDVRVDLRIIAATHRDLEKAVETGEFRRDLYYRLNVVSIWVPPLRERLSDIPHLVGRLLAKYSKPGSPITTLAPATLEAFRHYHWPGNVRELENVVRRMVILGSEEWSPPGSGEGIRAPAAATEAQEPARDQTRRNLKEIAKHAAREAERVALRETLQEVRWNRIEAARRLGVSYKALLYKIKYSKLVPPGEQDRKLGSE